MKAVRIHSFGGPDVLTIEDVPIPAPNAGEVLIKVKAASVNPIDTKIRSGDFTLDAIQTPVTLGRDVSGVVEEVGQNVRGLKAGDEVYALLDLKHGGYAEYALANTEAVAMKPSSIDHIHAAGVPLAATTAWQGLFDHGQLAAGERVLIHGAAGGVGHFAVQFAKDRGAYVIATARTEDAELLRKLGADEVIDYNIQRFEDVVRDIDLVFDLVAGETQQRSWKVLKEGGRMISTLQQPSHTEAARHHAKGEVFRARADGSELSQIGRLIDDGKVSVFIQESLPLSDVRRAHNHLEHEHVRGKVVLSVGESQRTSSGLR